MFGILPAWYATGMADRYDLPFPLALYTLTFRIIPIVLVFALASSIPAALPFGDQVVNRYLFFTRPREDTRRALLRKFVAGWLVTFTTFAIIGLIPWIFVSISSVDYTPENSGLMSAEEIETAQSEFTTFSELAQGSPFLYVLFFSLWLGLNAANFGIISMATMLVSKSRLLGMTLPWVATVLAAFACAFLGLEAYSPDTVLPFNLTQLEFWQPMVPFTITLILAVLSAVIVVLKHPQLKSLQ